MILIVSNARSNECLFKSITLYAIPERIVIGNDSLALLYFNSPPKFKKDTPTEILSFAGLKINPKSPATVETEYFSPSSLLIIFALKPEKNSSLKFDPNPNVITESLSALTFFDVPSR
ncbi:MAG: hypothetical protein CO114_01685 [Euryarchaeota archaeon CG_4_9_14_3_um_filter_38_12]|nr:MAG: hypothetical protein CO114_01685 [Euryarchaeota archaeon CG_4_9_14_3_um_filter_38_12]